mmetsp:Transcript_25183/g.37056  ORF Transcript_25183/g.37056 Transcript_25183/m.37056 type:complete len:213 (-) Transcript_25183:236-874(-)|eukprot:CAMPEP_0195527208 /NCGR_PEP_ID=MMETSP0794_2-20130614/28720_1 /TAXON_ID=515487 /ORGANISM="Stephanopyxis turris, Strain CCMP 815" /LENGTH=212 /DNA_ID=CAMNT_0040658071 /DNA_START=179 /DNA_END=817 /DNA_ORIENTATION=+
MSKSGAAGSGHSLWSKMPKANSELFALTYGSLVTELIRDYDDHNKINEQLDRIGHSIGVRCVDEFLSKTDIAGIAIPSCATMRDTAEIIAKIGFRMFLGATCDVANVASDGRAFSLYLYDNPLTIFVELPPPEESSPLSGGGGGSGGTECDMSKIQYSNVYCGVIRGALEQVNLRVDCKFVRDVLHGAEVNEIRVELKEVLQDGAGDDYKEE